MKRKLFSIIILAILVCLLAAWVLRVPYRPLRFYRAIPANAMLVSSHDNLSGRWPGLATNIFTRSLINGIESALGRQNRKLNQAKLQKLMQLFASRKVVVAYVPALGGSGKQVWIVAAWVGSYGQYLRWSLEWRRVKGLTRMESYASRPIWSYSGSPSESGDNFAFTIADGIFLGCLSQDPMAIKYIIMAYDGLRPSLLNTHLAQNIRNASGQDVGWINMFPDGNRPDNPLTISYVLSQPRSDKIEVRFCFQTDSPVVSAISDEINVDVPSRLLGDKPALVMVMPWPMANHFLSVPPMPFWAKVSKMMFEPVAVPRDGNCLVLSALTGDYSGGLGKAPLRMTVPAIMAMFRVQKSAGVDTCITQVLDMLNIRYKYGLIVDPSPLQVGKHSVITIESTGNNILSSAAIEDRPAYAVLENWLIMSSSAGSLVKLLKRMPTAEEDEIKGKWQRLLLAKKTNSMLWLDFDSVGKYLQLLLVVQAMSLQHPPGSDVEAGVAALKIARNWIKDMRSMEIGVAWLDPTNSPPVIRIEIGKPQHDQ